MTGKPSLLDQLDLDDETKAHIRASVAAAPPMTDDTKSVIRRIWHEGREVHARENAA